MGRAEKQSASNDVIEFLNRLAIGNNPQVWANTTSTAINSNAQVKNIRGRSIQ